MSLPKIIRAFIWACLFVASQGGASLVNAQSPDPDTLTIEQEKGKVIATYTYKQLHDEFELHERTTATPWSERGQTTGFRGPLLKDILIKNNIMSGKSFEIRAYNDFITQIRSDEINTYSPILAIEQACSAEDKKTGLCTTAQSYRALTVDDGGPLYLIWPLKDLPPSYLDGRKSIWVWFVVALRPLP